MTIPTHEEATMSITQPVSAVWDDEQPVDHGRGSGRTADPGRSAVPVAAPTAGRSLYRVIADQVVAASSTTTRSHRPSTPASGSGTGSTGPPTTSGSCTPSA